MRRTWAILLLALFSFPLISPAVLASDARAKLPACCRRDGQHHCTATASTGGPGLQAARCFSFPSAKAAPETRNFGALPVARAGFAHWIHFATTQPAAQSLCR